jgi:hypothetical protein
LALGKTGLAARSTRQILPGRSAPPIKITAEACGTNLSWHASCSRPLAPSKAARFPPAPPTASWDCPMPLNVVSAFDAATPVAAETFTVAGTSSLNLSSKLGTGTETYDSLSFTLNAVSLTGLGMTGTETIDTVANAQSAMEAVNTAITNLNEFRANANVGAAQNRLDSGSDNLSIAIENAEAARSTLPDLDIASEMTTFTSKQVLLQSGVAMLAQATSCRPTCCVCCSSPGERRGARGSVASPIPASGDAW